MRILIVNKFFYFRGGDCIYSLNLGQMLRDVGHEVHFYAMNYPQNIQCNDNEFFAEEISFTNINLKKK